MQISALAQKQKDTDLSTQTTNVHCITCNRFLIKLFYFSKEMLNAKDKIPDNWVKTQGSFNVFPEGIPRVRWHQGHRIHEVTYCLDQCHPILVAPEHLKCDWCKLVCALSGKHRTDFKYLVCRNNANDIIKKFYAEYVLIIFWIHQVKSNISLQLISFLLL